jgi:CheY-like chemotaxis protein/anti-sigma regulatory factor (Ser/Thr protein kinase)
MTYVQDQTVTSLMADGRRLKQMLVNLLSNAVKFTLEEGKIGLEVSPEPDTGGIRFTVWDTGIGIDKKMLPFLFQPFMQLDSALSRKHAGTGLGLALVKKLAELHGGSVGVESEPLKGCRFHIILPLTHEVGSEKGKQPADQPAQDDHQGGLVGTEVSTPEVAEVAGKTDTTSADAPAESAAPCILIAEDNDIGFKAVSDYLRSKDYRVIRAKNGFEAMERAREFNPDLILMDIQMPDFDGLEAIRILRSKPKFASTLIVALTALAMPGDRERCLEAGADDYVSKPVNLKQLAQTIHDLLASRH